MRSDSACKPCAAKALLLTVALALGLATGLSAQATEALRTEALSDYEESVINDEQSLNLLGLSKESLRKRLAGKPPEEVKRTVASLAAALADARYHAPDPAAGPSKEILDPNGDFDAIPLNTEAGGFNARTVVRPKELDTYRREPGVFSLKRYVDQRGGVPTFNDAPIALRLEDLAASNVDVAFVGVPSDNGSGWRDAVNAPNVMRAAFQNYGTSGYDVYAGVDPLEVLTVADFGNLATDKMSIELTVGHVRDTIRGIADAGSIPFVVGGDHSVMYSTVAAMASKHGKGGFSVVQLDAHPEVKRDLDHTISDEQAVSALIRDGHLDGRQLIQVGIRGQEISKGDLAWLQSQGIRSHTMADVGRQGWDKVAAAVLADVAKGPGKVFVSFDASVLDPAYLKGAGRPAPNGLSIREASTLVHELCTRSEVVGFEMLDVAPYLDLSYESVYNANYIVNTCLAGIAARREK